MADKTEVGNYRSPGTLHSFSAFLKNVDNSKMIDITSLIVDLSIFEDIFASTIYGNVRIKDGVNLMNSTPPTNFPIVGEEFIEFEYKISGDETPVKRRFAVYSIKEIKINKQLNLRNYTIEFCSEEHLFDATINIQKSYRDQISNMVKDILVQYFKVEEEIENGKRKKAYDIQPTKGTQHIIVPNLNPLDALQLLASRSIAEKLFKSATYLFFENKDGFNFCDIEYLIQRGKKKLKANKERYQYYYQDSNIQDSPETEKKLFKTILSMNQKHKFDTIEKIKRGYFESDVIVYDFINRRIRTNSFKFVDNYKDYNTLGANQNNSVTEASYPENSLDFMKSVTEQPKSGVAKVLGMFGLNRDISPHRHRKIFYIPKNLSPDFPDTFLEEVYPNRASYMTRLAQNMFTIEIHGDPEITAGDVITIDLPEIDGRQPNKKDFDRFLSGYFLVSSIHHKISPDTYHCTIDLFKNGFSSPVITTDNADVPEPASTVFLNDGVL